jgi:NAD(P)-dependent dehydrogenase (short-subunit alcohol dehydrogenase family)
MIDATVRHFGGIDVLINNAATIAMAPGDRTRTDDVRRSLETNFIGPMVATNAAVLHMRRRGGGHIINISSPAASLGIPFLGPYAASKAALSGWTRSLQAEWEGTGIVVSEYLPGNVATGALAESELGPIGGDVFEDPNQHPLTRALARPQGPERIAADLVDLVRRPRPVMYSSLGARVGSWLAISSAARRALGTRMATTVRGRLGMSVFSAPSTETPAAAPPPVRKRKATAGKRKAAGKNAKPSGTRAKAGKAPAARVKRVSRKTSEGKPRQGTAREATKDNQPG